MFCQKCGFENEEGVSFCINCGESIILPVVEQTVVQPQYTQSVVASSVPVKKKKHGLIVALIVAVVLVLAVAAAFVFNGGVFSKSAEDTAKDFMQAVFDFDYDKAGEYSFIDAEKYFKIEEGLDATQLKENFESAKQDVLDDLAVEYGENTKITITVTDSKNFKGDEMENIINSYAIDKDYYKGEIKSITRVSLLLTIKGDPFAIKSKDDLEKMEEAEDVL
jgi:hypothetical protein